MIIHQANNSLTNYNHNAFFYTDKVWDFHFHRNPEIIYVVKGAVNCTVNNTSYRLTDGDFGLCLPYDIHRYEPEENTLYWALVFSEDYIRYVSKQLAGKTAKGFRFRCNSAVEEYIRAQLINNTEPSTLTLKSCLYAVCECYLSSVELAEAGGREAEFITLVSDYILENHTKKISLSDIAKKLGYDYNYMSRCFKRIFNMNFRDFVNIYRLETAISLLEDTDKSILDIAFDSGFQSVRSFNCFFKKNMALSPTEYRKASRK